MKVEVYLKASDPSISGKVTEFNIKKREDLERLKELLRRIRLD